VLWAMGRREVAYQFFRQALEQDGGFVDALENAAVAAEALGQGVEHAAWVEALGDAS
jgi:hypothetical protein